MAAMAMAAMATAVAAIKGVDSDGDGGGEGDGGRGDGGGGSGEGDGGNRDGSGGDRGGNGDSDSDGKVLTTSKAARATMTVTCGGIRQQRRAAGGGGRRQRKDRNQGVMEVARTESEVLTPFLFGWRLISKWPRRLCNDLARSLRRRQCRQGSGGGGENTEGAAAMRAD